MRGQARRAGARLSWNRCRMRDRAGLAGSAGLRARGSGSSCPSRLRPRRDQNWPGASARSSAADKLAAARREFKFRLPESISGNLARRARSTGTPIIAVRTPTGSSREPPGARERIGERGRLPPRHAASGSKAALAVHAREPQEVRHHQPTKPIERRGAPRRRWRASRSRRRSTAAASPRPRASAPCLAENQHVERSRLRKRRSRRTPRARRARRWGRPRARGHEQPEEHALS